MAMAFQTAVLGMKAYNEMLNVTGDNIANADTVAYKSSRITFSEMFYRTLNKGQRGGEMIGGSNPFQVGQGVKVSSVDRNMGQGTFNASGKLFDLGIDGEGFFVLNNGVVDRYTRDGSFDVDDENYLVDPSTGYRVQRVGITGEAEGFQEVGDKDIRIPYDTVMPGSETTAIDFRGNLTGDEDDDTTSEMKGTDRTYRRTTDGGLAEATDLLSDVDLLDGFAAGDSVTISGQTTDGTAVAGVYNYAGAADTIQDILNAIDAAFTAAGGNTTASFEDGTFKVTDGDEGYSLMDMDLTSTVTDADGNDVMPAEFDYVRVGGETAQTTNIAIYDHQGRAHDMTATFVRHPNDLNVWDLVVNSAEDIEQFPARRIAGITFDEEGVYQSTTGTDFYGNANQDDLQFDFPAIATTLHVDGNFGESDYYDGLTQFGGSSSAGAVDQDGYAFGSLQSISVDGEGVIGGIYTNGEMRDVAVIGLAVFDNPQGLERVGGNYYQRTPASGGMIEVQGLRGRAGRVRQNVLEESNVDITEQFTRLLTAQRGFQVNSRTIRIANQILQQLTSVIL